MKSVYVAVGFFALAAIIGMYLLTFILRGKETPKAVAFTHGIMAAVGLVLLLVYWLRKDPAMWDSVVLFAVAAVGGLYLIMRDLTAKPIPKWLAVAHGLIAVTGFVFLLVHAFA